MKDLFITGGPFFMWVLTILLIIAVAWIIFHFIVAYSSKKSDKATFLRKLGYGKSIGLFALVTGILGQMFGLFVFFSILEEGAAKAIHYAPSVIYRGLEVTVIVTIYGTLIYLLSLLLWFVTSFIIEKKING